MASFPTPSPKPERFKTGAAQRVLILADPPPLLARMTEVVKALPGLQLAGAFSTTADLVDWTVWDRGGWHYAFVDLGLPDNGTKEVVQRLLSQPRPGTVVALGAHLWREIRSECAKMGVYHLLEKGDLIAFQGFLEEQLR
jgi:DNA-binding NarL/FixJ family response regulator